MRNRIRRENEDEEPENQKEDYQEECLQEEEDFLDFQNLIAGVFWTPHTISFRLFMTDFQAILLSFLINFSCKHPGVIKKLKENKGWFYCSAKLIAEELKTSIKQEERTFQVLREIGVIQTEMRSKKFIRKRWIKINYEVIKKKLNAALNNWNRSKELESSNEQEDD